MLSTKNIASIVWLSDLRLNVLQYWILDIGLKLGLLDTKKLSDARDLLFRIVSMFIKMVSSSH